jgi:hypothetical protein
MGRSMNEEEEGISVWRNPKYLYLLTCLERTDNHRCTRELPHDEHRCPCGITWQAS